MVGRSVGRLIGLIGVIYINLNKIKLKSIKFIILIYSTIKSKK